ncbi:hypothetical protein [Myxosarcina sp. GI1(2024)]
MFLLTIEGRSLLANGDRFLNKPAAYGHTGAVGSKVSVVSTESSKISSSTSSA